MKFHDSPHVGSLICWGGSEISQFGKRLTCLADPLFDGGEVLDERGDAHNLLDLLEEHVLQQLLGGGSEAIEMRWGGYLLEGSLERQESIISLKDFEYLCLVWSLSSVGGSLESVIIKT